MLETAVELVERKVGPQTAIVGVAAPTLVYILSAGRTAKLRKVQAFNGQAADITLQLGTGATLATFVPRTTRMRVIAGFHMNVPEDECPEFEYETDIYALPSAAGAAALAVDVQVAVDEVG